MKKLVLLGALALAPILAQAQGYSNYGGVSIASFSANCIPLAVTAVTLQCSALVDGSSYITSTEPFAAPQGTQALPSFTFSGNHATGIFGDTATPNQVRISSNGSLAGVFSGTAFFTGATGIFFDASNSDTALVRDGAVGTLALKNANTPQIFRVYGGNGGFVEYGTAQELLTLSTSGTTTDTTANLLPANSYIDAVDARVTTTITTATSWQLGDAATAGRFSAVNAVMTSGSTQVGTVQADQTGAAGPRQVAAAKVRVTTVGTPGAGVIRIMVHYHSVTPPTS